MTVHPFIKAEKQAGHSVKRACELMKVSRTAFYARRSGLPGPRAVRDAELTEQITEVHARSRGTYGAPRVHAVLMHRGAGCGRRRVARLMRAARLQGRHRRRRHLTTIPDPRAAFPPNLIVRDFQPARTGLDARWCGDITYVPTEEGWLYLATVIDIASRRVVGWATADHLRTELVADALTVACRQRRPTHPVIFHSDRGCQYTRSRVATLIGRKFHVSYSVSGATRLMHRLRFSPQVPARRVAERDEQAVTSWREATWAEVKGPGRPAEATSVSRTKPASPGGRPGAGPGAGEAAPRS